MSNIDQLWNAWSQWEGPLYIEFERQCLKRHDSSSPNRWIQQSPQTPISNFKPLHPMGLSFRTNIQVDSRMHCVMYRDQANQESVIFSLKPLWNQTLTKLDLAKRSLISCNHNPSSLRLVCYTSIEASSVKDSLETTRSVIAILYIIWGSRNHGSMIEPTLLDCDWYMILFFSKHNHGSLLK